MMRKISDKNIYDEKELFRENINKLIFVWNNCIFRYDKLEIKINNNNARFIYLIGNILLKVYAYSDGSINYKIAFKNEKALFKYRDKWTNIIDGDEYSSELISDFDTISYYVYLSATDFQFKANNLSEIIENISSSIDMEKLWN